MTTKFIGMKELRQNMAKISSAAQKKGERLIVMRKNKPMFELRPLSDEDALAESFIRDIKEARADIGAGRVYTQKEMEKRLGL